MANSEYSEQLDNLNTAQREAVEVPAGNVLVLAGAGSGKTRVLVHRIAWLISAKKVDPRQVFAVTFTNKAAKEMRSRLSIMLPSSPRDMWVGTFHGLSHKLLRLHWKAANLSKNFQVLDSGDQQRIIRNILKQLGLNDDDRWEAKDFQHFINNNKDRGVRALQLGQLKNSFERAMAEVYACYEKYCQENGLVDFAELLLCSFELLKNNIDLLSHYRERFKYFLVDEFQDTNKIQYDWLKIFGQNANSVFVVGDDDQSIYGWRGARIENIYRFEKDFKTTKTVRLEQNYRSTKVILSAANALIDNNSARMGKTLWTQEEQGEPITVYAALNEEDEALYVVRKIKLHIEQGGRLSEIGILYRSNAQSRVLEEALMRSSIDYQIYGGLRFFERAEIKDALAYLKLAVNYIDDNALGRIINVPPRGIGDKAQQKIKAMAISEGTSLWEAGKFLLNNGDISKMAANGLESFFAVIAKLSQMIQEQQPLASIVECAIYQSGLIAYFKGQKGEQARSKAENLEELINATGDFLVDSGGFDLDDPALLVDFLDYTSLDGGGRGNSNEDKNAVQLMTLHSAKGLEYPVVFICGVEEKLFPHYFSQEKQSGLEEERRLCYVGITRAMQKLYICYSRRRRVFGREEARRVSRFVGEIPQHLVQEEKREVFVSHGFSSLGNKTGAGLVKGSNQDSNQGFGLGQRVLHAKFGSGVIVDNDGAGDRERVNVQFDRLGNKWLVLAYAKLETA